MVEINSNLSDMFVRRELEKRSIVKKIPDMFSKGINLDYILKLCCDSKVEITRSSTMGECIETHFYKLIPQDYLEYADDSLKNKNRKLQK